jgi:tetratricopeptide (TPR) repeat protein
MTIDSSAGLDQPPPVKVESVLHGEFAILFSRKVGALARDEAQKGFIDAWTKNYSWVDVQSVDWVYDANAGEFRFSMKGVGKPGAWSADTQSGSQVFEIDDSAFAKPKALARPAGQDPQAPFAVKFPGFERSVTVVKLPNGGEGFSLVGDSFETVVNGVDYHRTSRFEHGMVVMSRSVRVMTTEVTAAQARADNAKLETFDTASTWIRSPFPPAKAPQDADSLVSRGYDLLNQDRPGPALALFDQALAVNPANVAARVGRADVFAGRGDFDNALAEYARASQTSTDPVVSLGRGGVLFAAGRFDQAIQVYSEALARAPIPALYRARAEAYAAQDQIDRALQDAEVAIKAAPDDPEGYSLRAALYLGKRDNARALADFDRAVRLDPDDSDNLVGRGSAYAAMKQYDRAVSEFDEAVRVDPAALRPLQARADANARAGRFDVAVRDLDRALELSPGSPALLNTRCWTRAGWGQQLDLAMADCEAALKSDPKAAAFLDSRGLVNLRLGKLDEAIADYNAALRSSPKLASSLYGRGLAKLKKGEVSSGKADLAAAKASWPEVQEQFDRFGLKP